MHEFEIDTRLEDHAMRAASIVEHAELLAFDDLVSLFDREFTARDFCHPDKDDRLVNGLAGRDDLGLQTHHHANLGISGLDVHNRSRGHSTNIRLREIRRSWIWVCGITN